jgi:Protein of unknown function (DUF3352)
MVDTLIRRIILNKLVKLIFIMVIVSGSAGWITGCGKPKEDDVKSNNFPKITRAMSAKHTIGFFDLGNLPKLVNQQLSELKKNSKNKDQKLEYGLGQAIEKAGFDLFTEKGWKSIGIGLEGGLGIYSDDRLIRSPILLAQIDDELKLRAWVEKIFKSKSKIIGDGDIKTLKLKDKMFLYGKKGNLTLITMGDANKTDFTKILKDSGPNVASRRLLKQIFKGIPKGPKASSFLSMSNLVKLVPQEPLIRKMLKFYTNLFPAMGYYFNQQSNSFRLSASKKGVDVLKKLFVPKQKPPAFSNMIAIKGWGAIRISVNLKEVFKGMEGLIPPGSPPNSKMAIQQTVTVISTSIGMNWSTFSDTFSGQVVLAGDVVNGIDKLKSKKNPEWLVLAGVKNRKNIDGFFKSLTKEETILINKNISSVKIAGINGWQIDMNGIPVVAVLLNKILIFAPTVGVAETAIKRSKEGKSLKGKKNDWIVDDKMLFGFYLESSAIVKLLEETSNVGVNVDLSATLKEMKDISTFNSSLAVDDQGIISRGNAGGFIAVVGILAAILIPAFTRYMQKTDEVNIQTIP